ncbi:hypothetical protein CHUAL_003561 [Chamberlinius hualienensis]
MAWKPIFEETGMSTFITLFKYFGLKFDSEVYIPDPRNKFSKNVKQSPSGGCLFNWFIVCVYFMEVPVLLMFYVFYIFNITSDKSSSQLSSLTAVSLGFTNFMLPFLFYYHCCRQSKTVCRFLRNLATEIRHIQKDGCKVEMSKSIRKIAIWCAAFHIFMTFLNSSVYILEIMLLWEQVDLKTKIGTMFNIVHGLTLSSFSYMVMAFLIFVCKTIEIVIENCIKEAPVDDLSDFPSQTVPQHQVCHQKMSALVRDTDQIFSQYLLVSMINELSTAILFGKAGEAQEFSEIGTIVICLYVATIYSLFIVKVLVCANLNDKVIKILFRKS